MASHARVRAPELTGEGGWLNTGGTDLTLADLRGRIVLLDFWTFCCVNCLHVLDELRELEEQHRDTARDHRRALAQVRARGRPSGRRGRRRALPGRSTRCWTIPELATWKQYAVRAWPTLVVIDPEGYVVAQHAGEGHAHAIATLVEELEREHAAQGHAAARRRPVRAAGAGSPPPCASPARRCGCRQRQLPRLRHHPASAGRAGAGRRDASCGAWAPASAGSRTAARTGAVQRAAGARAAARHGGGRRGRHRQPRAARRTTRRAARSSTLAGTGEQWWQGAPTDGPAREVALSSPWDVAWFDGRLWIAMAGVHQLWTYDPRDGDRTARCGSRRGRPTRAWSTGRPREAWFAQPSGLAASADGERLWIADSETCARALDREGAGERGRTSSSVRPWAPASSTSGTATGRPAQALLQHPLGVTALPDGSVAVSDTYNHALRRYDPVSGEVTTLATDLREPSDAVLVGEPTGRADIVVVESAAAPADPAAAAGGGGTGRAGGAPHAARRRPKSPRASSGWTSSSRRPAGQKLDDRYGPSTRLLVSSTPPELLAEGAGAGTDLSRDCVLADGLSRGRAACLGDGGLVRRPDGAAEQPEYPACHVHQQDWGVPVRITESGTRRLPLVLAGMDDGVDGVRHRRRGG